MWGWGGGTASFQNPAGLRKRVLRLTSLTDAAGPRVSERSSESDRMSLTASEPAETGLCAISPATIYSENPRGFFVATVVVNVECMCLFYVFMCTGIHVGVHTDVEVRGQLLESFCQQHPSYFF